MNKIVKNALILTAITLVAGILLGGVYEVTKEPIRLSQEKKKVESYKKVMPDAVEFEDAIAFYSEGTRITRNSVNGAVIARNAEGKKIGSVITTVSREGYGGEIKVSVGILDDGTVTGIEILSINETAGLGMRATEPEFKDQFKDVKTDKFVLTKEDPSGEIDALSGATITSRAVTGAVNAALEYHQEVLGGGADE